MIYVCDICGRELRKASALSIHTKAHNRIKISKTCSIEDCDNIADAYLTGHCGMHQRRWEKYGDVDNYGIGWRQAPFMDYVNTEEGTDCLLWSGPRQYQSMTPKRYSWLIKHGSLPNAPLKQECGNFDCVNSDHSVERPIFLSNICETDDCNEPNNAIGLCVRHYYTNWKKENQHIRQQHEAKRRALYLCAFIENTDRQIVFDNYHGVCYLCEKVIDWDSDWEEDHIIPLTRGGMHSYENVAPTHKKCNNSKNNKLVWEYLCEDKWSTLSIENELRIG